MVFSMMIDVVHMLLLDIIPMGLNVGIGMVAVLYSLVNLVNNIDF
jgi:hypothetical protein